MPHSPHSKGRATRCGARFRARHCGCEPRLLTRPGVMPARRANLGARRCRCREGGERGVQAALIRALPCNSPLSRKPPASEGDLGAIIAIMAREWNFPRWRPLRARDSPSPPVLSHDPKGRFASSRGQSHEPGTANLLIMWTSQSHHPRNGQARPRAAAAGRVALPARSHRRGVRRRDCRQGFDGVLTSWNKAAETMFGYTAGEIIGQPITLVIPPNRIDEETSILDRVRRGERRVDFETERQCKDGRVIPVTLTISPIRDDQGRIVGVSKIGPGPQRGSACPPRTAASRGAAPLAPRHGSGRAGRDRQARADPVLQRRG